MNFQERVAALAQQAQAVPNPDPLPKSESRELHIDGDYAAYYFSGKEGTSIGDAKANLLNFFRRVQAWAGVGGRTIIHLTHGSSDKAKRYKIATVLPYQGQRSGDKPANWAVLRQWLEHGTVCPSMGRKIWFDREADDGVAASAQYALGQGRTPVILSRDKDFRMIPGLHIVWTTLERVELKPEDFEVVNGDGEVYGHKWFWLQMLHGDSADHIPGLEKMPGKTKGKMVGCGPARAEAVLAEAQDSDHCYYLVAHLYQQCYGDDWADRFAEQAALLWMRRGFKAEVDEFTCMVPKAETKVREAAQRLKERVA